MEEDAFLRAISDRPEDALPKLVYADWLDDRGDVRGACLRWIAERGVGPAHDPAEETWDWWARPPAEPDYYPDRAWTAVLPPNLFGRLKGRPSDVWKGYKSYLAALMDLLDAWQRCVADEVDPVHE